MSDLALSGQLPNDVEHNGLIDLAAHMADAGKEARMLALVVFDVPKITVVTDSGVRRPIVRLVHIEPIGELADVSPEWKKAFADLKTDRLGDPLPEEPTSEVYSTGPDDDPARATKLGRAKLQAVAPALDEDE